MKTITRKKAINTIAEAIVEGGLEPEQIMEWIIGHNTALKLQSNDELADSYEYITGEAVTVTGKA